MHKFVNRWRSFYKSVCITWNSIALNNFKDTKFGYKGLILLILIVILPINFKNTSLGQENDTVLCSRWAPSSGQTLN